MALQYDTSLYGVDITPFLIDGEAQKDAILLWWMNTSRKFYIPVAVSI